MPDDVTISADAQPVVSEVLGRTLVIRLNRPRSRNAVTLEMANQIAAQLDRLDDDPELSVAVITGVGEHFCAGMDLKGFAAGRVPVLEGRGFAGMVERPARKPLVAAVEGYALGGGFEIALACDLLVAGADAVFGLPEVRRGLTANGGGLLRLAERIPYHHAMELVLTGRVISAEEAGHLHLLNRLVSTGGALDSALEIAAVVARSAPLAVQASKEVLTRAGSWPYDSRFERQREVTASVRTSRDALEGATAFVEKRDPVWSGR